nr:unnamed protein product [Digitaria exilis]
MTQVSVHALQGWIQYAFQNGVKFLDLDMQLPPRRGDDDHGDSRKRLMQQVRLDDLPSPAGLETMRLALGGARLELSTAVKFASLKELSLESIEIADGGGARLLARLVSSPNCPHLQKLRMSRLRFPASSSEEMRIEADMLSELCIEGINIMSMELRTPSLRVLHVDRCHNEVLSLLAAPRLEQVAVFSRPEPRRPLGLLRIDGDLPRVHSLKLCMWSHRHHRFHGGEQNDSCVLLMKRCSLLKCLEVTLGGPKSKLKYVEHVDLIKDKVPHLPHITSLTVNVSEAFERHNFGAGVANLLTRFTNLTHLNLHLPFFYGLFCDLKHGLDLDCDHSNHWTSHEISMVHLQDVELTGLTGVDCELWFTEAVLASAKILGKVTISFHKECCQHQDNMDAFQQYDFPP